MAMQFQPSSLFGGAITVDLPSTYQDVGDIRQVPDNQEVYLDTQGFTSITFDLLERVTAATDVDALRQHLDDIVESDADVMKVWMEGEEAVGKMPGVKAVSLLATTPPGEKQKGRANEPDFVGLLVTVIRLESVKTDVVVSVNVPHIAGQYARADVDLEKDKVGALLETARIVKESALASFEVKDWGLFVQDG